MDFDIAYLLTQDGITSGAIYAMMALGIVLVFNVTRVIFVPFGDLVAYTALTLGYLQTQRLPGTIWLVIALTTLAFLIETTALVRTGKLNGLPRAIALWLVLPLVPVAVVSLTYSHALPLWLQIVLGIILVLPIGPALYRVVYQPVANASVLVLLMISVALHFAISGLALLAFGPEGLRTVPYVRGDIAIGSIGISIQMLLMIAVAMLLSIILFLFFEHSLLGKALRATAMNREGARLVGIRTTRAGLSSFLLASLIAGVAGVLISPTTTIYYDTGFMVGLKGFVGATVGAFISYPAAVVGAVVIGLIESVSSFYASALKEVIVFAAIIPIVLWRWLVAGAPHIDEEVEEE